MAPLSNIVSLFIVCLSSFGLDFNSIKMRTQCCALATQLFKPSKLYMSLNISEIFQGFELQIKNNESLFTLVK